MKTLYKQLKPELRRQLLKNSKQYTNATAKLIEALKNKHMYSELTVREVQSLATFTDVWVYECHPLGLIYGDSFME